MKKRKYFTIVSNNLTKIAAQCKRPETIRKCSSNASKTSNHIRSKKCWNTTVVVSYPTEQKTPSYCTAEKNGLSNCRKCVVFTYPTQLFIEKRIK